MASSEFDLIEQISRLLPASPEDVVCGVGDDCAVLKQRDGSWLLATTDSQIENIHFKWEYATPAQVGARVMAVNLSDIAAMGGTPRFALVDLRLPAGFPDQKVTELYEGLSEMASRFGVTVVGGNTSFSESFSVAVTLLGDVAPANCKFRKGAAPGDLIYLTGAVGWAALGLAELQAGKRETIFTKTHLCPRPHIQEGLFLGSQFYVTSLIDISDGLSLDLNHVLDQSGVGAGLESTQIPTLPDFVATARQFKRDPLELCLTGGEDYVLLATVTAASQKVFEDEMQKAGFDFKRIGEVRAEPGLFVDGTSFVPRGFDHLKNK